VEVEVLTPSKTTQVLTRIKRSGNSFSADCAITTQRPLTEAELYNGRFEIV